MRVLMTGGGTAGHVNPAIAIANTIKKYEPDSEIAFVCSSMPNDAATDLVHRAGYDKLYRVDICGSYKIWNPKNIKTMYYLMKSAGQARRIVDEFKPDIIIGTGGFACFPVLNAGVKKEICTVVHESNAIPGKAVKKLAPEVSCVMVNFEQTLELLPNAGNIVRVGNPVIESAPVLQSPPKQVGKSKFSRMVLSFGGSRGAEYLNIAVADMLAEIADKYPDTLFLHAAGKRDFEHMQSYFADKKLDKKDNVTLKDYIYDMNDKMKEADIVISRAGAMTLSELALYGKAAVIVPSPNVAANHQYKNAYALYAVGAACLVQEKEFESGRLKSTVEELLNDKAKRDRLRNAIKKFATPDANKVIYDKIKELLS